MNGLGRAAHKVMMVWQVFAFCDKSVGAGLRHPMQLLYIIRGQRHTIWHFDGAIRIIRAAACGRVKELAGYICDINLPRIFVLKTDNTSRSYHTAIPIQIGSFLPYFCVSKRVSLSYG
jgi:hypothetical protein